MKSLYLSSLLFFAVTLAHSQESTRSDQTGPFELGIGVGLDYGGVGAKLSLIPFRSYAQAFLGLGLTGAGVGFNTGILVRSSPERPFAPYFTLMYGYNGVLITESVGGGTRTERTYYGLSFGGGVECRTRSGGNFFTFGLLFPILSDKFEDSAKLVNTIRRPKDVMLSLGYHFILD